MRAMFLDPGRLRSEWTLQAPERASDGLGGYEESWIEVASVMALVEPVGAGDRFLADARADGVTHRVTLRWRDDVEAGMRFARGARHLEIRSFHDPDETRRYLVCRCREERR